jgi:phospholipase/carboxylesterase
VSSALELLVHQTRPPRGEPGGALVLLHGRGTDEHDLLPLLDQLDPNRRLFGVTPRAPLELSPGGFHWYVVPRVGYPDPATFWSSYRRLEQWLAALPELTGVEYERTVLGGFSMGAAMSYALGIGRGRPSPAGVIALSGFIPTVEGFTAEPHPGLRVAVSHGTLDPVIPVDFARAARERLEAAGVDLLYHEAPIPHAIDPAFIPTLRDWLGDTISASTGPNRE